MSDSATEALRAENNPKFYSRFKWLGLAAIGFMIYCLYDGYVNYPDQKLRGEAFFAVAQDVLTEEQQREVVAEAHSNADRYKKVRKLLSSDDELAQAWAAKATEDGLAEPPSMPPEPETEGGDDAESAYDDAVAKWRKQVMATTPEKLRTDSDIVGQYVMAGAAALGAIYFLLTVWRTSGRWVELNDDGIATSWGETFSMDQVTAIDKKQWRDKGIARVRYTTEGGRRRTFVVDDYKYHRPTTDEILRRIEQRVGVDKIVGGKPEPAEAAPVEPDDATVRA